MRLLETITVQDPRKPKTIELYCGDLTLLGRRDAVDVLVVSSFPHDYTPSRTSLIGGLHRAGISVADLARNKDADLREASSCWMSQELPRFRGHRFRRILCFEVGSRSRNVMYDFDLRSAEIVQPAEIVGDIFRSLAPFLSRKRSTVAMPVVGTGDMGSSATEMLNALVEAAVHWMSLGLPLQRLKIVERSPAKAERLSRAFVNLKHKYSNCVLESGMADDHDVFISYAHDDSDKVSVVLQELTHRQPDLRLFVDKLKLNPGAAWQQKLYEALDSCRKVIAFYSPSYLAADVCLEEFNIALFRRREEAREMLIPIYLYSAQLPTYMKLLHFLDCREGNDQSLRDSCGQLSKILRSN